MSRVEKLLRSLAFLMLRGFYGTAIICFDSAKVTHVETETRRVWEYQDLPAEVGRDCSKTTRGR